MTTASQEDGFVAIHDVECEMPLPDAVAYYPAMGIEWRFSMDSGATWLDAGVCENSVYITLGDPLTSPLYHTLAHLGCVNATGETDEAGCTEKIWDEFTDRDVRRVDGTRLTYYASYLCENVTTADLLLHGDGQCGAWVTLFLDIRKVQGITEARHLIRIKPRMSNDKGFIVKNWNYSGDGSAGVQSYPYCNIPVETSFVSSIGYHWKFAEVTDAEGLPGQGTSNTASLFNCHYIVMCGALFDPSYGTKYQTLAEWARDSLAGYFDEQMLFFDESHWDTDLNNDGDKVDTLPVLAFLFREPTVLTDVTSTPLDY